MSGIEQETYQETRAHSKTGYCGQRLQPWISITALINYGIDGQVSNTAAVEKMFGEVAAIRHHGKPQSLHDKV
jgi:hypothetical protein